MKVAVVGGGIVGLLTSYFLQQEGVDVTLFEKAELGSYSIHAAGLIEPYRFDRINTTGMIAKMLNYVAKNDTVIRSVNKDWLLALLRELNVKPPQEAWDAIREMAKFSLSFYKAKSEEKNDFDYYEDGLYEAHYGKNSLERAIEEEKRSPFQAKFEVVELEGFAGAVYFPELSRLSTEKFVERMARELNKVKVVKREVNSLEELKEFDSIVLATGVWTTRFLKVPLTAFKGYGYRVKGTPKFKNAVVIADEGVAISPLSDHVKITGGFDADFSYDSTRAQMFLEKAKRIVNVDYVYELNMGFRPCSPDGFPIIGKRGKVVVATGACRLGWSYAPAMGKKATDLVVGRENSLGFISRLVDFSGSNSF
ncbi:MAG: FAD-dependent oxidoreductase [Candidatus Aramenus sulfurataquae]|uniref:FAD-binding oxidoreductase n=2 Tax=Candidatus Aramenus sulfurataquae TaxID=1326980 RepID=A0A0F2LPE6_9CREN|nr:FAD-binding oxidoreductase [Candidatus Aramenus sulfurataquae]